MACAANVQVGPARQSFWALHLRGSSQLRGDSQPRRPSQLRERTRLLPRRGLLELTPGRSVEDSAKAPLPGRLRLNDGGVRLELALEEDAGIQARCPNGRAWVWTRKQVGVQAHGTLSIDGGAARPVEALAVIDETAGYHERVTEWRWAAGVGIDPQGSPLSFNLVEGVNDPPSGSERAVWVAGVPHEVPPVRFAPDLTTVTGADGSELRFDAEAERRRRESLLIVRSEYRAPFGLFSGTLPGGLQLLHGLGVMEHHRARW